MIASLRVLGSVAMIQSYRRIEDESSKFLPATDNGKCAAFPSKEVLGTNLGPTGQGFQSFVLNGRAVGARRFRSFLGDLLSLGDQGRAGFGIHLGPLTTNF